MDENQILASIGRAGWNIVGRERQTREATRAELLNNPDAPVVTTDEEVWVISKPGFESDTITVRVGPPKHLEPGESTAWGPGITGNTYTVTKPPTKTLPRTGPETSTTTSEAFRPGSEFGLSDDVEVGGSYVGGVFKPHTLPNGQLSTRPKKVEAGSSTTSETWIPDPNNPGREISGRYVNGVFTPNTMAGGVPISRAMKAEKQPSQDFTLGGTRYSWDGDPTHKPVPIATEPTKPQVLAGEPKWRPIEGTNQQQAYQIIDGKVVDIPGLTKTNAQKLIAPENGETWTVVDENGDVVKSYPNPGYKKPPPTAVTGLSTETPYITTRDPTSGAISTQLYPGYQPKTQVDVAAHVGRLQSAAQQKRDELKAKIGTNNYTGQDAARDFDQWWNQNVEPQKAGLAAAQNQAQLEAQQKADADRRQAYTTAQAAGQQAASIYQAGARNRVGPQFGNVVNQLMQAWAAGGKLPANMDIAGAVTYQGPTADQIAEQATANALKFISPTAAGIAGGTPIDFGQALNAQTYANAFGAPFTPTTQTSPFSGPATAYRVPQEYDPTSPFIYRGPLSG